MAAICNQKNNFDWFNWRPFSRSLLPLFPPLWSWSRLGGASATDPECRLGQKPSQSRLWDVPWTQPRMSHTTHSVVFSPPLTTVGKKYQQWWTLPPIYNIWCYNQLSWVPTTHLYLNLERIKEWRGWDLNQLCHILFTIIYLLFLHVNQYRELSDSLQELVKTAAAKININFAEMPQE